MDLLLPRAAVIAIAFAICSPVLAQEAATPPAAPIRFDKADAYQDQDGKPISAEEFDKQVKAGQPFYVAKKPRKDGPAVVTFHLTTKDKLRAMEPPPPKVKKGDRFPEFRLARLDGTLVDNKSLEGRYTLVSFYFEDCAPCVKKIPELNAFAQSRNDVNILAVTFDTADQAKRFVAERKFNWPVVADARKLISAAGVRVYPSMALIDPQGRLVEITVGEKGAAGEGSISAWLDKKIAEKL